MCFIRRMASERRVRHYRLGKFIRFDRRTWTRWPRSRSRSLGPTRRWSHRCGDGARGLANGQPPVLRFRPQARVRTLEQMTGIEPALSAWEAGEPTSPRVLHAQRSAFEDQFCGVSAGVGARGGPRSASVSAACPRRALRLVSRLAFLLDQHAAQDLARGRLRDLLDRTRRRAPSCRARRARRRRPSSPRGWPRPEDDERLRHLAGLLVGARDDRRVGDRGVGEQHRFQLGRRHLVALVLDQLLEPVDDEEPAVLVGVADVAGVQPAVGVDVRPSPPAC